MTARYRETDFEHAGAPAIRVECVECERSIGAWPKTGTWPIAVAEKKARHDALEHDQVTS